MSAGDGRSDRGFGPRIPAAGDAEERSSNAGRLVDIAAARFRTGGYARTSTRQLGDVLGIRGASLYHYISSKEDLLYEICVRSLTTIMEDVERVLASETSTDARLRAMISAHLVRALTDRDLHATMLIELRELSTDRRADIVARRHDFEMLIRAQLQAGQDEGLLRADIDAKYLTLGLLNLLNWTIFWYEPEDELSPEELADIFCDMYLDGVRSRN